MKNVLLFVLLLLGFASCREVIIYKVDEGRPILFSQQVEVESRAQLSSSLENLNGHSFGVRAYLYKAKWASEEALATPDPDWLDLKVDCDNSGMCQYDSNPATPDIDWKYWEPGWRYSFFGYYPYSKSVNTDPQNNIITLSAPDVYGAPLLIYRLSDKAVGTKQNQWTGDRSDMYDVMYGSVIDAEESLTSSVDFTFHHCLTGIQLVIENFSENKKIIIESLALNLKIHYRSITVPMDGDPLPPPEKFDAGNGNPPQVTFHYIQKGDPVREIPNTFNKPAVDVDEKQQHILIIPQKGIEGTALVTLRETDQNGQTQSVTKNMSLNFPELDMKAGTRYVLDIQFLDDNVNVLVVEGNAWTDKDSDIEFE